MLSWEIAMQVRRWGNSLAVRPPAAVVEALNLREGDEITIEVADPRHFRIARDARARRGSGNPAHARLESARGLQLRPQ